MINDSWDALSVDYSPHPESERETNKHQAIIIDPSNSSRELQVNLELAEVDCTFLTSINELDDPAITSAPDLLIINAPSATFRIIVTNRDPQLAAMLKFNLIKRGHRCEVIYSLNQGRDLFSGGLCDTVIADLDLNWTQRRQLIEELHRDHDPRINGAAMVIVSGLGESIKDARESKSLTKTGVSKPRYSKEEAARRKALLIEEVKEWFYAAGQVLVMVGTILGGMVYGAFALFHILFPSGSGKSPVQIQAERDAQERRRQQEHARWEAEREAYDEERERADREATNQHNKDVEKLNNLGSQPVIESEESKEDDGRVKELNNALKGAENGTESMDNVRKMRDELFAQRKDMYEKDDKRRAKYSEHQSKAHEASALYAEADRKMGEYRATGNKNKYYEAEDAYKKAAAKDREAKDAWTGYLSV